MILILEHQTLYFIVSHQRFDPEKVFVDKQLHAVMRHRAVTVNQNNTDTKAITIHQKALSLCRAEVQQSQVMTLCGSVTVNDSSHKTVFH